MAAKAPTQALMLAEDPATRPRQQEGVLVRAETFLIALADLLIDLAEREASEDACDAPRQFST